MLKQRSLLGLIGLSIITCGIYGIVWYYLMTDSINKAVGEDGKETSPGIAVLLVCITFGIYPLVWLFIQGNRMQVAGQKMGVSVSESGGTYLLWMILGSFIIVGPFVAYAKFLKNYNALSIIYNQKIAASNSGATA